MKLQRQELLHNLERITGEIADLKRTIMLEFGPSPNGKNKAAWEDLQRVIKDAAGLWDKVTAVEEIRKQREK